MFVYFIRHTYFINSLTKSGCIVWNTCLCFRFFCLKRKLYACMLLLRMINMAFTIHMCCGEKKYLLHDFFNIFFFIITLLIKFCLYILLIYLFYKFRLSIVCFNHCNSLCHEWYRGSVLKSCLLYQTMPS